MILGVSQIDITPRPGVELSGFAARTQPSLGVLDPLFAKALYLADGPERLLWIHCDLIGFEREFVRGFREWAREKFGLRPDQVLLSATHTHSGPGTMRLQEVGAYEADYVALLEARLREAALAAADKTECCDFTTVEGRLPLAVDRRRTTSSHTDPRVAAIGFRRREDNAYAAVIVNYPMHPVALGASNRHISADIPGQAALALAGQIPGHPVVLVTNGACGNLNPPAENVAFAQIQAWGGQIADAVAPLLNRADPVPSAKLRVATRVLPLPLDVLTVEGIEATAAKALKNPGPIAEWGDKYRRAVEHWRRSLIAEINDGHDCSQREAELFAIGLGDVILLGANAEVFSEFTDALRRSSSRRVYLLGYANGDLGYLPTRAAYAEGGYEVEVAHFFYDTFRPRAGALEFLGQAAADLLRDF